MPQSEERKAYLKAWRAANKERVAEQQRAYCRANRERIAERKRTYYWANKESCDARSAAWAKENPDATKRYKIISVWRQIGVVCDDFRALYDEYLAATHCADCGVEFAGKIGDGQGKYRCLDHCHATGAARGVVCCGCNLRRGP
jgi:hypothetical protein